MNFYLKTQFTPQSSMKVKPNVREENLIFSM